MSFNWFEYLGLAQQLAGKAQISATQESRLRSAISRAYYAAFIIARNHLRDGESISIPEKQTHKFVIEQFKNSSEERCQKIGKKLVRLRFSRNKADYDDRLDRLPEQTKFMLKLANKTISDIQNLGSDSS
ncbi:MAG: hypothetical protein SXA11_14030 [Cyanobacteriota bacterium]|nr:hypothetical protein [Cyanobacteriota bacterium]